MQSEKKIEDRILSLEYDKETTERHYKELRSKVDHVSEDITTIKNAVIGNSMNGNIGMVTDIKKLKDEVFELQLKCIKHELYFRQIAVLATLITGALITALIKLYF